MKDPLDGFKKALESMRDDIGKDKTYAIIKETMESLIAVPKLRRKSKLLNLKITLHNRAYSIIWSCPEFPDSSL